MFYILFMNMKNFKELDTNKRILDLREWWKQIKQSDVEKIMNKKDKWNYWWFSEDKKRITTLKGWKINNYKANETKVLFVENTEKIDDIKQESESEILINLYLSPNNKVKDSADAFERARLSNKTVFWFLSKWNWNESVIILDFSKWKNPKIKRYPLDKYNLKIKPVRI